MTLSTDNMNIECGTDIAISEALAVILKHEKIPYEFGAGVNSRIISIASSDIHKVRKCLAQWSDAVNTLNGIVSVMKMPEQEIKNVKYSKNDISNNIPVGIEVRRITLNNIVY